MTFRWNLAQDFPTNCVSPIIRSCAQISANLTYPRRFLKIISRFLKIKIGNFGWFWVILYENRADLFLNFENIFWFLRKWILENNFQTIFEKMNFEFSEFSGNFRSFCKFWKIKIRNFRRIWAILYEICQDLFLNF